MLEKNCSFESCPVERALGLVLWEIPLVLVLASTEIKSGNDFYITESTQGQPLS
jgi:hypothetical protein